MAVATCDVEDADSLQVLHQPGLGIDGVLGPTADHRPTTPHIQLQHHIYALSNKLTECGVNNIFNTHEFLAISKPTHLLINETNGKNTSVRFESLIMSKI